MNFFGYSTTTSKDIKHINAIQQHLAQEEQHVEHADKFADKMSKEAHSLENKERGVITSVPFYHQQLPPLLVNCKPLMAEVRYLQHSEKVGGTILLMDLLDIRRWKLSYVVTQTWDIFVVKVSSFRQLCQYVPTNLLMKKKNSNLGAVGGYEGEWGGTSAGVLMGGDPLRTRRRTTCLSTAAFPLGFLGPLILHLSVSLAKSGRIICC